MIDAFTLTKKNDETNNNSISFIDRSSYSNNNDDSNVQNFNSSNAGQNNPNFNVEFDLNDSDYHLIQDDVISLTKRSRLDKLFSTFKCSTITSADLFHNSSLFGTSFNFVNSILGSGVIGIPYAIAQSGFGVSFFLFLLVGILTDFSIVILISTGEKLGVQTYQDLVYISLGRFGYFLLVFIQFLYPFISLTSYNIIIGDTVTKVFIRLFNVSKSSLLSNRHIISLIVSCFVLTPLSLFRNIAKLSKTSLISCIILVFIQIVMIVRIFTMTSNNLITDSKDEYKFFNSFDGLTDSFSLLSFAFMCHHNSFLLYTSMKNPTIDNWKKVTHSSVSISVVFSLIFGMVGYLTFNSLTQGDIFENYCHKDDLINIVRLFYSLIIMFSFPLELFVCRDVIENTFFNLIKGNIKLHTLLTISIVFITMFLSFTTDCLGIVLEINGSLVATILAYILPSLCAVVINYRQGKYYKESFKAMLIFLIGLVVVVSGLISIFHKIINGYDCSHGKEMSYCSISHLNSVNYNSSISYSNYFTSFINHENSSTKGV